MKHFNNTTPKNIPVNSPLFPIQQNYSPYISPYIYPLQLVNSPLQRCSRREEEDQEFVNFNLQKQVEQKQQQKIVKHQQDQQNDSDQNQVQQKVENISTSKVHKIIEILVRLGDKAQEKLIDQRKKYISEQQYDLRQVYEILLKKFKKLKKTKEQMTKYCMRKAFKFLSQKIRKQNTHIKDSDSGLKYYFSHYQNDQTFTIPFKKNSLQKTMNTNFLKKVFSSQLFLTDYLEFLKYFRKLVEQDNIKKINYLAEIVETHLTNRTIKKLENIKRLPWTQTILDRTQNLAQKLTHHSPFYSIKSSIPLQKTQNYNQKKQQLIYTTKYQNDQNNDEIKKNEINEKNNRILVTPLMRPLSPPHIKQQNYSESSNNHLKRSNIGFIKDEYEDEYQQQ